MYGSVLRHLGLSAVVSSALAAAIAVSGLTSPSAASPVVRLRPERAAPPTTTPRMTLISSVKIRLEFDGKPFN
ncbi:hypothetical protein [Streptomyces guryensis]|uniref:Uncharacterized protein n=1 Tax=Streptomyces guryensis TaxID=2886947 RepID=A0A9Q3Z9S5_9ACTN|nr:hypothetical protein [Streptomyces guryensis]MCD9876852.1 hypothetical protein [Streptomyces guryensis]